MRVCWETCPARALAAPAKNRYRAKISEMLVNRQPINNLQVVIDVLNSITDDECRKEAIQGW